MTRTFDSGTLGMKESDDGDGGGGGGESLTVTAVSPATAVAGSTPTVILTGTGLLTHIGAGGFFKFEDAAGGGVWLNNPTGTETSVSGSIGAGTAGVYHVVAYASDLTTKAGEWPDVTFTLTAPEPAGPTITGFTPASIPANVATTVTVTGTGLREMWEARVFDSADGTGQHWSGTFDTGGTDTQRTATFTLGPVGREFHSVGLGGPPIGSTSAFMALNVTVI